MFFAVIGDIESNFSGLKAVLTALDNAGIYRVLHTGNSCTRPENAGECLALLRTRGVLCVQGRKDKQIARAIKKRDRDVRDPWIARTHAALTSDDIEYLARLPRVREFIEESLRIRLCHGAVNSPAMILHADTSRDVFLRQREIADADIVVCGGATTAYARHVDGVFFVSPGVMTETDHLVRYTIVNTETDPWSTESVQVPVE